MEDKFKVVLNGFSITKNDEPYCEGGSITYHNMAKENVVALENAFLEMFSNLTKLSLAKDSAQ